MATSEQTQPEENSPVPLEQFADSTASTSKPVDLKLFIQSELAFFKQRVLDRKVFAKRVHSLLADILEAETGERVLERGFGLFFAALYGGAIPLRLFCDLYFRSQAVFGLSGAEAKAVHFEQTQVIAQLENFIRFYRERKGSLEFLARQNPEFARSNSQFFNLRCENVRVSTGQEIFRVRFGLFLVGHREEYLRVRLGVSLPEGGASVPVRVRKTWCSWVGSLNEYVESLDPGNSRAEVCACVDLKPETQTTIVDSMELGLPLGALDLQPGEHQAALLLSIEDRTGERIVSEVIQGTLKLPKADETPLYSGQVFNLWPRDLCSAAEIQNVRTAREDIPGASQRYKLSFDLELADFQEELVRVECRILSVDGMLAEALQRQKSTSNLKQSAEDVAPFLRSFELRVDRPHMLFRGLLVEVSSQIVDLLKYGFPLFWEVAIRAIDGRIICGKIEELR